MEVPEGFEDYYPGDVLLFLLKTIYGLKQAAMAFWRELLKAMRHMQCTRSNADPCLYFKWNSKMELTIWLSWIDDCLCIGPKENVLIAKKEMMSLFECNKIGNMDEHLGCWLECNFEKRMLKFTQPVLLQSFNDEFDLPDEVDPVTPAEAGQVLRKARPEESVLPWKQQRTCRTGIGKLLQMVNWSRPECPNLVREL